MPKLIKKQLLKKIPNIPQNSFEEWLLDNGLEITLFPGETKSTFSARNDTGILIEAILEHLKKDKKYASLELIYSLSPQIKCASELVQNIFDDIEKMDIASLGKGKSY